MLDLRDKPHVREAMAQFAAARFSSRVNATPAQLATLTRFCVLAARHAGKPAEELFLGRALAHAKRMKYPSPAV